MRFVDKITKSKYFQKATETEFIKKKMEEVSNTPLLLTVEVQHLQGTLAVNIPPPPTDRIWYVASGMQHKVTVLVFIDLINKTNIEQLVIRKLVQQSAFCSSLWAFIAHLWLNGVKWDYSECITAICWC